jgi:hypothetical protein
LHQILAALGFAATIGLRFVEVVGPKTSARLRLYALISIEAWPGTQNCRVSPVDVGRWES